MDRDAKDRLKTQTMVIGQEPRRSAAGSVITTICQSERRSLRFFWKQPPRLILEPYPNTVTPIAASFMLAPTVILCFLVTPTPIVGINANTELRAIVVPYFDVPAIAFTIADDLG